MRKKEHIHVHALLAEVTGYLIEDGAMPVERLSAYDALGTRPSSIHKSKQNHHEAVAVLGSAIELSLEEARTDDRTQSMRR